MSGKSPQPTKPPTRRDLHEAERHLPRPASVASSGRLLSVALVYPHTYHIGMSSLGYQLAWRTIEDHPAAHAERFFTDTVAEGSIETGRPLASFDVIALSGAYEMDDPLVIGLLESAGLPPLASRRAASGRGCWPLVVMGGVLIQVNRAPLYPFIDVFVHGDAEVTLPPILSALAADGVVNSPPERLQALAGLPGVEVTAGALLAAGLAVPPGQEAIAAFDPFADDDLADSIPAPPPPPRVSLTNLEGTPLSTQILSPHTEFSDMALVDLARGCPHHCTFCWIGHNTPPYRQRGLDHIFHAIETWMPYTNRFGLVSSAVGAHEGIDDVCRWMMARDLKVSYSSLRVEEVTSTMLEAIAAGGQKSITIAPEAGNRRVRRLLGKMISDDQILEVVERAMTLGVENIKLYYMIGIPSETDDEALDIARFSERIRQVILRHGRARGRVGTLGFNLGIFVPKPNLPLNHIEPSPLAAVKKRLKLVVKALQKMPNTRLNVSSPELADAQSVLSMGGVEAAQYAALVHNLGGDWREANRRWRPLAARIMSLHSGLSRTAAQKLREHAATGANP